MKIWVYFGLALSLASCHASHTGTSRLQSASNPTILKILKGETDRYFNVYGNQAIEVLHCGDFNQTRAVLNLPSKVQAEFNDYLSDDEFSSLTVVKELTLDCQKKSWQLVRAFRGSDSFTMQVSKDDGEIVLAQIPLVCSGILNLTGWEALDDLGKVEYREPRPNELDASARVDLLCGGGNTGPTPTDPSLPSVDNDGWELATTYQTIDELGTAASIIEMKKGSFVLGVASIDGKGIDQFVLPGGSEDPELKEPARNLATVFRLQQDMNNYDLMPYHEMAPELVGSSEKAGMPVVDLCWTTCENFQPKHFYYDLKADGSVSVVPVTNFEAQKTLSTHPDTFGRPQIEWAFRENPRTVIVLDPSQDKIIRSLGLKVVYNATPNFDLAWNPYTRVDKIDASLELPFKVPPKTEECHVKFDSIVNRYVFEDAIAAQCGRDFRTLHVEPKVDFIEFNGALPFNRSRFTKLSKVVFDGSDRTLALTFKPTVCASCELVRPGVQVADGVTLEMHNVKYSLDASLIKDTSTQFLGIDVKAANVLLDRVQITSAGRIFDIGLQSRSSSSVIATLLLKSIAVTAKLGISSDGLVFMRKHSSSGFNSIDGVSSYGVVASGTSQSYLSDLSVSTAGQGVRMLGNAQVLLHNTGLRLQPETTVASQAAISIQTGKMVLYKSQVAGFRFGLRKEPNGERADVMSTRTKYCVTTLKTDQSNRINLSPGEIPLTPNNECSANFPSL